MTSAKEILAVLAENEKRQTSILEKMNDNQIEIKSDVKLLKNKFFYLIIALVTAVCAFAGITFSLPK